MKQRIRLTEGNLHRIIKNSVKAVLKEDFRYNDNFEPHQGVYKYLKEIQAYMPSKYEDYLIQLCNNLKYIIENNKEELDEEHELKPLQKVIDTVEGIFFDIDNLDDMITDLVHERSVEYYQRYGD